MTQALKLKPPSWSKQLYSSVKIHALMLTCASPNLALIRMRKLRRKPREAFLGPSSKAYRIHRDSVRPYRHKAHQEASHVCL